MYSSDVVVTCTFMQTRFYFNFGVLTMTASFTLILYMAVYLSYCKGITLDWMEYCPNVIYTTTLFGVLAAFS